ncbi:DNA-directed DNA polymerase eta rad30 [Tulasnella sp. 419]|nr:DNA-directed DNA polymerase eta rad30 [Tulasnella sp. 419]
MLPFSVKGKQKATEAENETEPIIRYRHLLTNSMGALDPLRVIALCDLDAFYAAAERVRLGIDPELPLAVQQWQGLIAVNYPARKFGITRMENVTEAKKKCPDLILVHVATYKEGESEAGYHDDPNPSTHKVSLDHYRRESTRILNVHQEMMPAGGEVEKASIDEAFFDFTIPVKEAILARYPHLSQVPEDSPEGLDTPLPPAPEISWDGLGNLVFAEDTSQSESEDAELAQGSTSDANTGTMENHKENSKSTWHDVALSIGAEFMMKMRMEVKTRLGYTTSAGIARNKMLAKLVASYKKMDQQSILRNSYISEFLRPMPFQKIRFLGGKLGDALADEFGAKTVGDVL